MSNISFHVIISLNGFFLRVFTNNQISAGGPSINDTAWNAVASAVGCGNSMCNFLTPVHNSEHIPATDSTQFSCMQNVTTTDLAAAVSNTSLSFSPVLDGEWRAFLRVYCQN